jgi:hypothetical protein
VLLPASVLLRRADAVEVIGAGLLAAAGGLGHRRVAGQVERPVSTVRGWLARTVVVADRVVAVCAAVAAGFAVSFAPPAPAATAVARMVEMVGAMGRAAGRRLGGSRSPWRLAALVTSGRLLAPAGPDLVAAVVDPANTSARLVARGRGR